MTNKLLATTPRQCQNKLPSKRNVSDAMAPIGTRKISMLLSLLETIANTTTKSKTTIVSAKFTLAEVHEENNEINVVKIKHVLLGVVHEITLKLLALRSGPRQYLQRQQEVVDRTLATETTKNNILLKQQVIALITR